MRRVTKERGTARHSRHSLLSSSELRPLAHHRFRSSGWKRIMKTKRSKYFQLSDLLTAYGNLIICIPGSLSHFPHHPFPRSCRGSFRVSLRSFTSLTTRASCLAERKDMSEARATSEARIRREAGKTRGPREQWKRLTSLRRSRAVCSPRHPVSRLIPSSSSLPHSTRPSRLSSSPPHVSLYPFPHPSSSLRLVTHLPFPSPSVHRAEPGPTGEVMSGRMERVSEPAVGARSHLTFPLSLIAFRLFTRSLREVKPSRR